MIQKEKRSGYEFAEWVVDGGGNRQRLTKPEKWIQYNSLRAEVAELADALRSGRSG